MGRAPGTLRRRRPDGASSDRVGSPGGGCRPVGLVTGDAADPDAFEADHLQARGFWGRTLGLVPTRANGQPAFAYYLPDPTAPILRANGLMVLTLAGDQVCGLTRFGATGILGRLGLPRTLPVC